MPGQMARHLVLVVTVAISTSLPALEPLSDDSLADVSGQDGLTVNFSNPNLTAEQALLRDPSSGIDLRLNSVSIAPLDMRLDLDVGATAGGTPGLKIAAVVDPFRLKSDRLGLQVNDAASASTNTFGLFAMETVNPTTLGFSNSGGLLNSDSTTGQLDFNVRSANWYLAQPRILTASGGNGDPTQGYNVLVFRNFNLRGSATGSFGADPALGLRFLGKISLPRISSTNNGLQLELGVKDNVNFSDSRIFDFDVVSAATTQSHWRFGLSGDLLNADISLIGGAAAGIGTGLGGGAVFRSSVRFARSDDTDPFVLEMGEPEGSTVRFSDWVALSDGASPTPARAVFDMGTIYVNLLAPSTTSGLGNFITPATSSLADALAFGALGVVSDANQNSIAVAMRDFNFQGYARGLSFHNAVTGSQLGSTQSWSLIPTFYGLNANLLAYGSGHPAVPERHGMGMDLRIETTGKNTAFGTPGTAGTHLLIADTAAKTYIGFRNIDSRYSFRESQLYVAGPPFDFAGGSGLNVIGLRLSSEKMEFDIRAGFALGSLPDGTAANRIRDDDDIFGMRWKFAGDFTFTFSPPPSGQSYIGITSTLVATDPAKNGVYIVEPVDGTRIEWIDITGRLNLVTQHEIDTDYSDASRIDILRESVASNPGPLIREKVSIATAYQLAPGTGKDDVIRIGGLNLYRPPATNAAFTGASGAYKQGVDWKPGFGLTGNTAGTGTAYRLGEMVIPGGRFYGQVDLRVQ